MKSIILNCICAAILQLAGWGVLGAQEIHMSYPGLTGESAPLWVAREAGYLKGYGIDAKLIYMEGGRLSKAFSRTQPSSWQVMPSPL